jgi:2-C-methyl-D-erythritol 4-phosphate cytidylyltransferase
MLTAIIVAAGSSQRMGFDKLFSVIAGKPVIAHTIHAFERAKSVTEIIVVAREDRRDELKKLARSQKWRKIRSIVLGGARRQDSVCAGLGQLGGNTLYVSVHDAARPLITPKEIERVFQSCRKHGGAALAGAVTDTLKRADVDFTVTDPIDRNGVYAIQTPQIFEKKLLKEAYRLIAKKNLSVTDEVSAVEVLGRQTVLVPNHDFNFKITFQCDLPMAEFILKQRAQTG